MAVTYTLISSNVLGGTASSVTFSSIPSTYTDLVIRFSARTSYAGNINDHIFLRFNGGTGDYGMTYLMGTGSSAAGGSGNVASSMRFVNSADGNLATANIFSNGEFYIPSYAGTIPKPVGAFNVLENDGSTGYVVATAGLAVATTAAITSITLTPQNGPNFVANSSFYLYGIKNS